jgi:hypothetical protein
MFKPKTGKKLGIPASISYMFFALSRSLCSRFAGTLNPKRTGLTDNIFTRRDRRNCPHGKEYHNLLRTDHNDLLILNRLLPSSNGN